MKNKNFVPEDILRILSSYQISENEPEAFYIKTSCSEIFMIAASWFLLKNKTHSGRYSQKKIRGIYVI